MPTLQKHFTKVLSDRLSPASSPRRFDSDDRSRGRIEAAFGGNAPHPSSQNSFSLPCRSRRTSGQSVRRDFSSIGKHGDLHAGKHFDFAEDSVASSKFSAASRRAA